MSLCAACPLNMPRRTPTHSSPIRTLQLTEHGEEEARRIRDKQARAAAMAYLFAPLPWEQHDVRENVA